MSSAKLLGAESLARTRSCETMLRDQMSCRQRSNGQYPWNRNSLPRNPEDAGQSQS